MTDHYIHWRNLTNITAVASARHGLAKRNFYSVTVKPGGTGTPYKPRKQSFEYTIRWYDEDENDQIAEEFKYVCVEDSSYLVQLYKEQDESEYKQRVSMYPSPLKSNRPVYLISHRVNEPDDIVDSLIAGANAIECDVKVFDDVWRVTHGLKAGSAKLSDWLKQAHSLGEDYPDQFALIILDIKTPEKLQSLVDCVNDELEDDMNVLFSTADYSDRAAFDCILDDLGDHRGVAIDFDKDPQQVQDYFIEKEVSSFWYGYGVNVAGARKILPSITEAGELRDDTANGIKKTYGWTLRKNSSIIDYFIDGVTDGVMVNEGNLEDAKRIIEGLDATRMATRSDPAFEVFK